MPRTSTPAYPTVHGWLNKDRGLASDHLCHGDCGGYAQVWAYTYTSTNELRGMSYSRGRYGYELPYSKDLSDYAPYCRKESNYYDALHGAAVYTIIGDEDETGMWLI